MTLAAAILALALQAQSPDAIREEAMKRPGVMRYASDLMDGIGPRLTGSPNLRRAIEWARGELAAMGCANVRAESWGEFGMGWRERNTWLRMTAPDVAPLIARAAPWSPATRGPVAGELIAVKGFSREEEFAAWRGKLAGKVVLYGSAPSAPEAFPVERPLSRRLTARDLAEFAAPKQPGAAVSTGAIAARFDLMEKVGRFFGAENVAAVIVPSGNNEAGGASGGTLYADTNYTFGWFVYRRERAMTVPQAIVAVEHYGRLRRLLDRNVPVRVEVNVDTEFTGDSQQGENLFAEIPGVDSRLAPEVVMAAAHLDSWSAGTGATDDGAGVVIAMEAMRILTALGTRPRRTIRLALWTGEEQGALGSRAWIREHIADLPVAPHPSLPEFLRPLAGPMRPKPGHALLKAVYTLDAGGGRIRGVSTGSPALVPVFKRWLAPFRDLGVTMVAARSDCGGDCAAFEQAGIAVPSFKQDPLEYDSRTHHTNMDSYERLAADDLKQAAAVVAWVLWQTAKEGMAR